jgi:hypothetical protein
VPDVERDLEAPGPAGIVVLSGARFRTASPKTRREAKGEG